MSRKLRIKVDASRAFDRRQLAAAVVKEFLLEFGGGCVHVDGLDDCFDFFAEVLVGHANHGDIVNLRVCDEDIFGFLGVNIDTAGDDHMCFPVGEIKPTVFVHVADVAKRRVSLRTFRVCGFFRGIVVLELDIAFEVNPANFAGR